MFEVMLEDTTTVPGGVTGGVVSSTSSSFLHEERITVAPKNHMAKNLMCFI